MFSVHPRVILVLICFFIILSCYFLYIINYRCTSHNNELGANIINYRYTSYNNELEAKASYKNELEAKASYNNELRDKPLFKTSVPMFYINLDSSKDRRRYMEKTFNNTGKLIRVRAVDGSSDSLENYITSKSGNLNKELQSNGCTGSLAALTASHIFAVKKAFDYGAAAAVILEDDASPIAAPYWTVSLDEVVENANKEIPGWQVIWLQYGGHNIFSKLIKSWKNNPEKLFSREKFQSYGNTAYLISRDGMRFLIDKFIDKEGKIVIAKAGCQSDVVLRKHIPNIYHKTPPMFTTRIHEDTTGVRKSAGPVNDHYMYHLRSAVATYSWVLQDYEIKTNWKNATEALSIFPIRLWTVQ